MKHGLLAMMLLFASCRTGGLGDPLLDLAPPETTVPAAADRTWEGPTHRLARLEFIIDDGAGDEIDRFVVAVPEGYEFSTQVGSLALRGRAARRERGARLLNWDVAHVESRDREWPESSESRASGRTIVDPTVRDLVSMPIESRGHAATVRVRVRQCPFGGATRHVASWPARAEPTPVAERVRRARIELTLRTAGPFNQRRTARIEGLIDDRGFDCFWGRRIDYMVDFDAEISGGSIDVGGEIQDAVYPGLRVGISMVAGQPAIEWQLGLVESVGRFVWESGATVTPPGLVIELGRPNGVFRTGKSVLAPGLTTCDLGETRRGRLTLEVRLEISEAVGVATAPRPAGPATDLPGAAVEEALRKIDGDRPAERESAIDRLSRLLASLRAVDLARYSNPYEDRPPSAYGALRKHAYERLGEAWGFSSGSDAAPP